MVRRGLVESVVRVEPVFGSWARTNRGVLDEWVEVIVPGVRDACRGREKMTGEVNAGKARKELLVANMQVTARQLPMDGLLLPSQPRNDWSMHSTVNGKHTGTALPLVAGTANSHLRYVLGTFQ